MDYFAEYNEKKRTVEECLETIKSGDRIFSGFYGGEPRSILRKLHTIADRVEGVELWKATDMEDYPVLTDPAMEGHIDFCSIFIGSTGRKVYGTRHIDYLPNDLHLLMPLRNQHRPCNIYMTTVSPMDEDGFFTLGCWAQTEMDAMEAADTVIVEVNSTAPRTFGETKIHIDQVDLLVESDVQIFEKELPSFTEVEESIGQYVASLIKDGDCIQLGIGGTSNVVARELKSKKDLGIHSEMFTDSMMELMKLGVINNSKKTINTGKTTVSFAWGSKELYEFIDGNEDIEFHRSTYVNDPFVIAQNDNMVSINTTLQVDLYGQVCSESIGNRLYSGTGGAFDFAYGALHSKGGRGIVAVPSTAKGGSISRISPMLTEGAFVSITRNVVDNIVTEYGIAPMRGRSNSERARNLIAVAHPDFREELKAQAKHLGIL